MKPVSLRSSMGPPETPRGCARGHGHHPVLAFVDALRQPNVLAVKAAGRPRWPTASAK
jgi:hypothetical protein